MQHIKKDHDGEVELTEDQSNALGLTACDICKVVVTTSRYQAHIDVEHADDAEDLGGEGGDSEAGGSEDTTPEGEDELEGAGEDGATRSHVYSTEDLFYGRLRPVRSADGEEAIVFAKMAEGILQFIFLAIQRGDEDAENWAALAFNLCPKLLGNGNKGERIKLMSIQIEINAKIDDSADVDGFDPYFGIFYFFDNTLPECDALAALAKNKKPKNPNGYFSSNARSRKERRRLEQRAAHKANKNSGKVPGNHILTAANITGEISLPVAKRMQRLMRQNMLGKAVAVLEDHIAHNSTVLKSDEITEDVKRQLEALHPYEAPLVDVLAEGEYVSEVIIEEEVMSALTSAARESAVAFSPWTYELLLTACKVHPTFLSWLTELLQNMLDGTLGSKDIWLTARSLQLLKPNGKIRPIAIGEIIYRLAGRVAARKSKVKAEVLLAPAQLGIGVSDGIGIATHSLQGRAEEALQEDSDTVVVAIDIEGAFNNILRAMTLEALKEDFPELVRLFLWAYADPTALRDSAGNVICMSTSGVKQGDAGGNLFFGVAFTTRVLQPVVAASNGGVTATAIHDDTYLCGKIPAVVEAVKHLEQLARGIGLSFNRDKCEVLRNAQNARVDELLDMPGTSDGIVALGVPIGTPQFVKRMAKEMFTKHGNVLKCIADLPPAMAVPILAGCVNGRPTHLLRALHPDLVREPAVEWDRKMDAALATICKATIGEGSYDDCVGQVRGLTTSRGGLGIKRLHLLSYDAHLSSFWRACWYMKSNMSQVWESCMNGAHGKESASEKISSLLEYYTFPLGQGVVSPEFYYADEGAVLRQSALTIVSQDEVRATLLKNKDFSNARKAMFISAGSHGTASFIYFETQSNRLLYLPTEAYREAIRLRLTLPGIESDPGFRQTCPCAIGDREDTELHGYLCNATSGARTRRHDNIVDALARFIKATNPAATVEKEVWLDTSTKADLRVTQNGTVTWVDVSIVAPNGKKYIALGSNKTGLVAAKHREETKRKHYATAMRNSVGSVTLVPFVLEITGAFGQSARIYLDKIANIETAIPEANEDMARKRRFFKKIVSAYLAIGNEHCLRLSRLKMHGVRRQQQAEDEPALLGEPPQGDNDAPADDPATILNNGSTPLPPERGREAEGDGGDLAHTLDREDIQAQDSFDASRKADDEGVPILPLMILPGSNDILGESPEQSREASGTGDYIERSSSDEIFFTISDLERDASNMVLGGVPRTVTVGQCGNNAEE